MAGIAKTLAILLRIELTEVEHQFTTPQRNKLIATDSGTTRDNNDSHMTTGLETLGAKPVNVVGVGGKELVLLEFVVAFVGSDVFA